MTVYPEGLRDTDGDLVNVSHRDRSWNGGECCGFAQYVDSPDTEFIAIHLLAKLSQNYNIDPSEVYVTGPEIFRSHFFFFEKFKFFSSSVTQNRIFKWLFDDPQASLYIPRGICSCILCWRAVKFC